MRWNQKAAVFTENTTETVNPARGFYSIFPFRLDEACDLSNMEYSLKKNQYLCLVEISIAGYRDRDLDRAGLDQFDQILRFFVLHGKDIILRVVYDWDGKGLEKEPLSRAQIKRHMQAVKMVLKPYQKALYLSQGIFVGSWGEMHTSRFLSKDAVTDLFFTWQAAFEEVPVALRRPDYIRMILSEENYRKLQKNDKKKAEENGILLAFYNDALFSSEDDLGTYGMEKKSKTNWESRWQREDEIDFLSVICRHCPAGGETVENEQPKSPEDLIREMQKMHLSYLNAQYDPGVLEQWKKTEVKKNAKETCSLYDYVEEKMGYRFVLRKAETDWRGHILSVEIENTGFGNLTKEAECFIEYEQKSEKKRQVVMTDPRKWDSGACQYLKIPLAHENFPRGEKIEIRIGLFLKDRNRPIRFANALAEETLSLGLFGYF